jgi:hypothetical protein
MASRQLAAKELASKDFRRQLDGYGLTTAQILRCDDNGLPSFDRLRQRRHHGGVFLYAFACTAIAAASKPVSVGMPSRFARDRSATTLMPCQR